MNAAEETCVQLYRDLVEQVTCPICMEQFASPLALPCLHTFCSSCITKDVRSRDKGPSDSYSCPLCREKLPKSSGSAVTMLKKNHIASAVALSLATFEERLLQQPHCTQHSQPCTSYRCHDHDLDLCAHCLFEHRYCLQVVEVEAANTSLVERNNGTVTVNGGSTDNSNNQITVVAQVHTDHSVKVPLDRCATDKADRSVKLDRSNLRQTVTQTSQRRRVAIQGVPTVPKGAAKQGVPPISQGAVTESVPAISQGAAIEGVPAISQGATTQGVQAETYAIYVRCTQQRPVDWQDVGGCRISGMTYLDENRLLLVDYMNNCMKMVDLWSQQCRVLAKFHSTPWGVAVCGEMIAVTFPTEKVMRLFTLNENTEKAEQMQGGTVPLPDECYGVDCKGNSIAVCGKGFVRFLEKSNDLRFNIVSTHRTIDHFENVALSETGERAFVTNGTRGSVSCIGRNGESLWSKKRGPLHEPSAIACHHGNLFVAYQFGISVFTTRGSVVQYDSFPELDLQEVLTMAAHGVNLIVGFKMSSPRRNKLQVVPLIPPADQTQF